MGNPAKRLMHWVEIGLPYTSLLQYGESDAASMMWAKNKVRYIRRAAHADREKEDCIKNAAGSLTNSYPTLVKTHHLLHSSGFCVEAQNKLYNV